jgi:ATP/maltotriose-dependent transcriptional regulator MalT/DNA-binding SARP family transcriptional activator
MPGQVVAEKVRRPRPAGLRRSCLLEPLLGPRGHRLALVAAPAGCGKTTLLAQAATAAGLPVGWYRAGSGEVSEAAAVRHLATALRDVLGPAAGSATDTDELLRHLDAWPGAEALLVVDDLHEIAGTAAEQALGRLLQLCPPRLRILLGSRRRPAVNLSRLQVDGALLEVDGDDLRFRSWEVERLFRDVYAEPLPPEAAAALTRRTEGWAAGLQLFHLATAGRSTAGRRAAVEALGGRTRLIRSYLAENVLAELDPDRRFFLTRTSALVVLSGPLCDELLGTNGSEWVLRDLEQAQLFTVSDDDGLTFRYHQVLQDHLEVALREELSQAAARAWFTRSAQLLERHGHAREALRAYARAEDWASVSQLLTRAGDAVAAEVRPGLDDLLPSDLREQDPWLSLAEARRRLRRGDVAGAVAGFRRAEELLPDAGFHAQCRHERVLASAWLPRPPPQPVRTAGHAPDRRHWTELLRTATVTLRHRWAPPEPHSAGARLELGLTHLLAGRLRDARDELVTVSDEAGTESVEHLAALAACGVLDLLTGADGTARLEQAVLAAEVAAQPWFERLLRAALEAALHIPADEQVSRRWTQLIGECEADDDRWGAALLQLLRGAVGALAPGEGDRGGLDEAAASLRRLHAPVVAVWADALRALQLARVGRRGGEDAALRAEGAARRLGVPGARAIACHALAGTGPRHEAPRRLAARLADECGIVLPDLGGRAALPTRGPPPRLDGEIALTLLGGFRLQVAGRVEEWAGVRPRALVLLRLLALSAGIDVHRERLLEALWPGVAPRTGTRRLQVAVSSLRQALTRAGIPGHDVLRRQGDAYRLALPPGTHLDVRELDAALTALSTARARGQPAAEPARRALALHRGELLPEDGPAEWVVGERERLRLHVAVAARELAEDCVRSGAVAEGVGAALRSLDLDPFQERPWAILARLHERAGDRAAAARARREQARAAAELAPPAPLVARRPRAVPGGRVGEPALLRVTPPAR